MILTCEECHARYLVPVHSLAPNGRKVRCGNCGHTWFENFPDAVHADDDGNLPGDDADNLYTLDEEPIPASVRPIPEGSSVPVMPGAVVMDLRARLGGYATAAAVCLLIFGGLAVMRVPVVHSWLPALPLFELAGLQTATPMGGLIFDQLEAKTEYNEDGVEILTVTGNITNLKDEVSQLSPIKVSMRVSGDETLQDWVIEPPADMIGPEETLAFTTTYPEVPDEAKEVNVRFVLAEGSH